MMGRVFDASASDRDEGSVVLSYGLWQSQFGAEPGVVGKTIRLDDTPRVIVGVIPAGFHFPTPSAIAGAFTALTSDDAKRVMASAAGFHAQISVRAVRANAGSIVCWSS